MRPPDANRLLFTGFSRIGAVAPEFAKSASNRRIRFSTQAAVPKTGSGAQNVAGRSPVAMISKTAIPTT